MLVQFGHGRKILSDSVSASRGRRLGRRLVEISRKGVPHGDQRSQTI